MTPFQFRRIIRHEIMYKLLCTSYAYVLQQTLRHLRSFLTHLMCFELSTSGTFLRKCATRLCSMYFLNLTVSHCTHTVYDFLGTVCSLFRLKHCTSVERIATVLMHCVDRVLYWNHSFVCVFNFTRVNLISSVVQWFLCVSVYSIKQNRHGRSF